MRGEAIKWKRVAGLLARLEKYATVREDETAIAVLNTYPIPVGTRTPMIGAIVEMRYTHDTTHSVRLELVCVGSEARTFEQALFWLEPRLTEAVARWRERYHGVHVEEEGTNQGNRTKLDQRVGIPGDGGEEAVQQIPRGPDQDREPDF